MRIPTSATVLLSTLVLTMAAPVRAAMIDVTVSGTIRYVSPQLGSSFAVGDSFTASFRIDSSTPDADPRPDLGRYHGAVSQLSVTFGAYTAVGSGSSQVAIGNSEPDPLSTDADFFAVSSGLTGEDVGGLPPSSFEFEVDDFTATAFSSDAIPTSLDLSDFSTADAGIFFVGGQASGTVESLTYTLVPEPSTGALLLTGILGLAGLGRQRPRA